MEFGMDAETIMGLHDRGASMTGDQFEKLVICRVLPIAASPRGRGGVTKPSSPPVRSKRPVGLRAMLRRLLRLTP
jgi:hypothetical protein